MHDRFIDDETMDHLTEWVFVNSPCSLEIPGFMKGIWLIVDDAIREAVEEATKNERNRVLKPSVN